MTGSERRTTQRFQMRLPITVRWTTGAAVGETSTESRDVSSRGVYFFLAKDVKEGSAVEILLTLPNEITLAGPVRVRCLGRIQRTEPRDQGAIGVPGDLHAGLLTRLAAPTGHCDRNGVPNRSTFHTRPCWTFRCVPPELRG